VDAILKEYMRENNLTLLKVRATVVVKPVVAAPMYRRWVVAVASGDESMLMHACLRV
jgi:hypothetical protein